MIAVLRYQHLREQARGGDTLVDDLRRHRRLDQRFALRTHPLAAHVTLDREHARRVVELLADVFADAHELDSGSWRISMRGRFAGNGARRGLLASGSILGWLDSAASSISIAAISASTVSSSRLCCSRSYFSLRAANFKRLSTAISWVSCALRASLKRISLSFSATLFSIGVLSARSWS